MRQAIRRRAAAAAGRAAIVLAGAAIAMALAAALPRAAPDDSTGILDPAWAPDGKHLAASWFDRIWTFAPDGKQAHPLVASAGRRAGVERDPAWSRDGARIAFAVDRGEGFDLYIAPAKGGEPQAITTLAGDERWPSWTPDGRIVFAHRDRAEGAADPGLAPWHLFVVAPGGEPQRLTSGAASDMQPRVSPDGTRVLFVSDRDSEDRDLDVWIMNLGS